MEVSGSDPDGAANLEKVNHVVVLMLENRSFDQYSVPVPHGRAPGYRRPAPGAGQPVPGAQLPGAPLAATALDLDPDHSSGAIDRQVAGGNMSALSPARPRPWPRAGPATATRAASWATTTAPICRSTITWRRSSPPGTAGSAGGPVPRCPTACTPCGGRPPEAGMTGRPIYRPCTTSPPFVRHLDAHYISWRRHPPTPGHCSWPTSTTRW